MNDRTNPSFPTRKRIRLDAANYAVPGAICSVTIATRNRMRLFAETELAEQAVEVIVGLSTATGVRVYAYSVMPDHVHLLISASAACDIPSFVGRFKNLVQRSAWRSLTRGRIWQPRFWDHVLRSDEDLKRAVEYVLNNPARAGLVERWDEYPYGGSLVYELSDGGKGQALALRGGTGQEKWT